MHEFQRDAGQPFGKPVSATDITAEAYAAVLHASTQAIVVTDALTHKIVEVNAAFERLFGAARRELVGGTMRAFWRRPSDREHMLQMVKLHGHVREYEVQACTKHGEPIDLLLSADYISFPRGTCLVQFLLDVSERRRIERAWRESEEKFAKVFQAAPYSVSIVDITNDRYVDVNEGFERLFGCRREQVVGRPVNELALWADPHGRKRYVEALQRDGFVREMPTKGRRTDGTILDGLASGVTLEIGGRRCLITFARDLTEQLKAERAKSEIEAQLREAQKLEALGVLAGGIAHDFNNILGAITAYTELVELDRDDDEAFQTDLDELRQANRRAKELVQQILTFSRRKRSERRPQRIASAVREALQLLRSTLPAQLEIQDKVDPEAPIVLADASQIHQIVMNLATNAAHAVGNRPGRLTVRLTAVDVSEAVAHQRPDLRPGPNVLLSVSDTGCGMDAQTCSRIFEPFFTTKGPGEGTGLGLAVVHGIALEHDAAVIVHTDQGKGTTFEIYFPEHPSELSDERELCATVTRGRGERVLVVEDEPALRYAVARLLERLGYEASPCGGPQEALERFAAERDRFDLVLTDLSMPRMSGVELSRQLLEQAPNTRIVIMSGFSPTWNVERLREIGVCELLNKPITAVELSRSLRAALDTRRAT